MELKIYVLVPLLGFIFGLFLAAYRFRTAFYILNLVVFILLGWISFQLRPGPAEFNIGDKAGFEAGGRIASHPEKKYGFYYFNLDADRLVAGGQRLEGQELPVKASSDAELARDDFIQISGQYTPGQFLAQKVEVKADRFDLYGIRKRTYSCLSSTYYTYLDYRYGAMCEAFMLGNRNHIGDNIKQIFSDSGIYHILAISGLHISVLLYIFLFLFRRTRWMLVPVMLILAFFNFLVGLKASLLRASIMMISAAMSQSWGRPYSKTGVFFTAYSVLLLVAPSFFTDLGFWLSFICIAAILFIFPVLLRLCPLSRNYLIKAVILSFSVVVATFPLNAYFFGLVTWTSLISNILILPIFYLLMIVLLLVSFIILMWPPLGGPLLIMVKPLLYYMEKVAYYVGRISILKWKFADFPRFWIAIYYVLLFFLLLLLYKYLIEKDKHGPKG